MLTTLNVQIINGLDGDPAVYVQLAQTGECILFDAGSLDKLSHRELLKIRVVAISHTHVDHFIGFDRLIRVNVPHFRTVEVIGPTGITANLMGKLRAYNWNLLEPGQLNFIVHEVSATGQVAANKLTNVNNFEPQKLNIYEGRDDSLSNSIVDLTLSTSNNFRLRAVVVDHGTSVLSFSLMMPSSLMVSKDLLEDLKFKPGPWIAELQRKALAEDLDGVIAVNGLEIPTRELANKLLTPRTGEQLVYVTDMIFNQSNVERITRFGDSPVNLLICESNYIQSDRLKASLKFHLTTYQAALLGATLRAKNLQIFHISNIYGGEIGVSIQEADKFLEAFRLLSTEELSSKLSKELSELA